MKKITLGLIVFLTIFVSYGCNESDKPFTDATQIQKEDMVVEETQPLNTEVESNLPEMKLTPENGDTIAILKTNHGEIRMLLYTELAPKTTTNFIELAKDGKYENVIFHRVINDFMVQGGDFENRDGSGGYSYNGEGTVIKDEFGAGLKHVKGAVSMANAGPNTGGSQFFIVQAEDGTDWLNGLHAIFGYVYEGMDNVDSIATVEVGASDRPVEDVTLESVEITEF